jgi:hypothetical protein
VYSKGVETLEATGHLTLELLAEFEANAKRPLKTRMRYAFLRTYKPVLRDARYRSFDTIEEYGAGAMRNCLSGLATGQKCLDMAAFEYRQAQESSVLLLNAVSLHYARR